MTKNFDFHSAIAALDEYGYDKKHSTDLAEARNKQQMAKYLDSLDFSLRRLLILQEVVNEAVSAKKTDLAQREYIQTYKTKIINLSRELNMSFQDIIDIMAELEQRS